MAIDWEARVEAVRQVILAAFVDAPRQSDARLTGPTEDWAISLRLWNEQILPHAWPEVRLSLYQDGSPSAPLLPAAAYACHLPGLLLAGLWGMDVLDGLRPDLDEVALNGAAAGWADKLALVSPAQQYAVGAFLDLCLDAADGPGDDAAHSNRFFRTHCLHQPDRWSPSPESRRWPMLRALLQGWPDCGHPAVERARALDEAICRRVRPPWRKPETAAVAERIEAAFDAAPKPGWEGVADTGDRWWFCLNTFEWQRFDWRCVSPALLAQAADAFMARAPEGAVYLLPAFMLAALEALDRDEWPTSDLDVSLALAPRATPVGECSPFARWPRAAAPMLAELLTAAQRGVVADCLRLHVAQHPPIGPAVDLAIARWWEPDAAVVVDSAVVAPASHWTCRLNAAPRFDRAVVAALEARIEADCDGPPPAAELSFQPLAECDNEVDRAEVLDRWRSEVAGRRWRDVSPETYASFGQHYSRLAPDVFAHYLPGVLLGLLRDGGDLTALSPSAIHLVWLGVDRPFERIVAALTEPQRQCVCEVLGLYLSAWIPDDDPPCVDRRRLRGDRAFEATRPLHYGWSQVDHPAVRRARRLYGRWRQYTWPRHQDADARALGAQLQLAFGATPPPVDGVLGNPRVNTEEDAWIDLELRGLDWRTVHPELLNSISYGLSALEPAGLRYLMPAFVLADLHGLCELDPRFDLTTGFYDTECIWGDPADWPAEQRRHAEYRAEHLAAFNRPEREALIAYLRYCATRDEHERQQIEQALERYWIPSLDHCD